MPTSFRTLITAGSLYGGLMGPFFAWLAWSKGSSLTVAALVGLGSALSSGLLFALLILAFLRLRWTRRQIDLDPSELLPGEHLLDSRLANLVVDPRDFGLRPFALGDLMFLAGLHRKEVIGGALHLTDLRLLFKAHRVNRLHGAASVFLPSIQTLELRSRWPFRRLRVSTGLADVEFIASDLDDLHERIEQARAALSASGDVRLEVLRQRVPDITQLQPQAALNALNSAIHHGRIASDAVQAALTPLAALGGLLASEVFDRGLAQRWGNRMR
jgi:hypothetical protein